MHTAFGASKDCEFRQWQIHSPFIHYFHSMNSPLLHLLKSPKTLLSVLIDPDKQTEKSLHTMAESIHRSKVDVVLVGGSLLLNGLFEKTIEILKAETKVPVIIFPGNNYQVSSRADAILLLSLISSRNPEYLIGQQVIAAPMLRQAGIPVIPTGYMLIDGGRVSTTSYITQSLPIPADKTDIAMATAMAGEMLGLQAIYLEAGSGASRPVPVGMLQAVKNNVSIPVIVGGGIREPEQAEALSQAGANMLVIGNVLEQSPELLLELSLAVHG